MVNKNYDQQVELVNLQGKKMNALVKLENSKKYNEKYTHTRNEHKMKAKQTMEDQNLLSNKKQEGLEIHQIMMECYSIIVFKVTIMKEPKEATEDEENLTNRIN